HKRRARSARAAHAAQRSKRSEATPPPTPPRSGEGRPAGAFSPFPKWEGGWGGRSFPAVRSGRQPPLTPLRLLCGPGPPILTSERDVHPGPHAVPARPCRRAVVVGGADGLSLLLPGPEHRAHLPGEAAVHHSARPADGRGGRRSLPDHRRPVPVRVL